MQAAEMPQLRRKEEFRKEIRTLIFTIPDIVFRMGVVPGLPGQSGTPRVFTIAYILHRKVCNHLRAVVATYSSNVTSLGFFHLVHYLGVWHFFCLLFSDG